MPLDMDRNEARKVVKELRASANKMIRRAREIAAEAKRLRQRADDLAQLIRQRDLRQK